MNENTFDIIDILQKYDGDYSGVFDLDEFTKFIHDIRYKKILQIQLCAMSLKRILKDLDRLVEDSEIR